MKYSRQPYRPYKKSFHSKSKKGYRKKTTNLSLVKVVKNIVNQATEHKFRSVILGGFNLAGGEIKGFNPLYWIPQDDSLGGRTGAKIQKAVLHMRGRYRHTGIRTSIFPATDYPWGKSTLRIMVIRHPKEWRNNAENTVADITTGGTGTNISTTEIFLDPGTNSHNIDYCYPNLKECKVVYDKRITCGFSSTHVPDAGTPTYTPTQAGSATFGMKVPLGDIFYQSVSSPSLVKSHQYYVICQVGHPTPTSVGGTDVVGTVDMNYAISFNDF